MPISPPARPFADGALALTDKDVAAALADLGVAASLSVMRNRSPDGRQLLNVSSSQDVWGTI
jgi:hypothetical protein